MQKRAKMPVDCADGAAEADTALREIRRCKAAARRCTGRVFAREGEDQTLKTGQPPIHGNFELHQPVSLPAFQSRENIECFAGRKPCSRIVAAIPVSVEIVAGADARRDLRSPTGLSFWTRRVNLNAHSLGGGSECRRPFEEGIPFRGGVHGRHFTSQRSTFNKSPMACP